MRAPRATTGVARGGGSGGDLFDAHAKMSRDVQQRRGGASAHDAAEAPVRVRTRSEESKISAAMWARVVVLSVVVLGFVGGVFYASSKMRFVEDILPKISGASARPVAPPRPPPRAPRPRASAPPVERFVLPAAPSNRPILTRVPLVHPRHPQTPVRSGRSTSRSRASR